jgi:sugar fermentation stimulation protein A
VGRGLQLDPPLAVGRLHKRYKRFLADIEAPEGEIFTAHCPNTGAMTGCSEPGSEVWYSDSANPARKYRHTLEVVCAALGRVGVNTARANRLVEEAIVSGHIPELAGYETLRREAGIPDTKGRFDFLLADPRQENLPRRCYVEVKNLTLGYANGSGAFPDAVSERALRHVDALVERIDAGDRAVLLFCVQHTGIIRTTTADDVHAEYGAAVRAAVARGLEVLAYGCEIERDSIRIGHRLPFTLGNASLSKHS